MSKTLTLNEVEGLLPEYVLGTLEPEEMLVVEEYLKGHQELMARLAELEQAVAHLAYSASTVPLPAQAKEQLMERVRADAVAESTTAIQGVDRSPVAVPARSDRSPARGHQRPRTLALWRLGAIAAILTLALLGLYTLRVLGHLDQATADREGLRNQVTQLEQRNEALQQELEAREMQLALLTRADLTVSLPPTGAAPGAGGLFYEVDGEAIVVLYGLDPLPQEQTYQLWWITAEGEPLPADLLVAAGETPAWQQVSGVPPTQEIAAIGVTVEPAGGSAEPTEPILLLGEVN
jgi:anti-sigma-K factor RskA